MATAAQNSYKPALYREQGGNILRFRGTSALFGVPECLLWGDAPVLQCIADPSLGSYLFEDFNRAPSDTTVTGFETIDDSGTGTCTYQDAAHGVFNVVTAASDNDYHAFASVNEVFNLGLQKKLWFEARFKLAYGSGAQAAWWFGLTDTTTTGGLQADALGPLADYDGALMWKDEDGTVLNFEVSNATVQDTESSLATFVSDTWTRVGFKYEGNDATTGTITPYYSVDGSAALAAGTAVTFLLASMTASEVVFGVKSKGTAETLQVDYVRCLQLR